MTVDGLMIRCKINDCWNTIIHTNFHEHGMLMLRLREFISVQSLQQHLALQCTILFYYTVASWFSSALLKSFEAESFSSVMIEED